MQLSPLKASELDVIELLRPLPDRQIPTGSQGTILATYPNDRFLIEFANDEGETIALCDLNRSDFTIVWQADAELHGLLSPSSKAVGVASLNSTSS
ncbi:MAG: DUF4926 domain-containing protein [Geitlerinemataceae cyanobacterium]